jgi:hypothetical protein
MVVKSANNRELTSWEKRANKLGEESQQAERREPSSREERTS